MKIRLLNGCSCSEPGVYPKTWERSNASIKKNWYIHYRFYDPLFAESYPNGYQVQVKGMNIYKSLAERQDATKELLAGELKLLKEQAYNPIPGQASEHSDIEELSGDYPIPPDTGLTKALERGLERLDIVKSFKDDLLSNLKFIKPAIEQLRMQDLPVKDVRRRHIVMILDRCGKNKDIWTAATYNRYRRNLSCIFRELVKIEAIEHNPIDEYLEQKKRTETIKEILTADEIELINTKLRELNFPFWRFIHIFCNSGARTTEIMKVKLSEIDLNRQMVRYTIKKGKKIRIVERPIKDEVFYLWEQLAVEAKKIGDNCYLFSEGLRPGENLIRTDQIKRRWRTWVQL